MKNDQELLKLFTDQNNNPDYNYIFKLFQEFYKNTFEDRNSKKMFKYLTQIIKDYNSSGNS